MQEPQQYDEFESLNLPKDIQIEIIDKDSDCKNCQLKIDYSNFNFEEYHDHSVERQLQQQVQENKLQTKMTKRPSQPEKEDEPLQENEELILIKGDLKRKVHSLFQTAEKRFCVLTKKQFFCFEDETRANLKSCINLKLLPCSVNQQNENIIIYHCPNHDPIVLEASNADEAAKWAKEIKSVIERHENTDKIFLKKKNSNTYKQKDIISQSDFLKEAETGDIILMKTTEDSNSSSFQRMITHSEFDHMGLIMKYDNGDVKIFESNGVEGVNLNDWVTFSNKFDFYEQVAYRKLHSEQKKELFEPLKDFVQKAVGGQYGIGAMKMLKLKSHSKKSEESDSEKRSYFCSELVARAYKNVGLLERGKGSARYWPADFTARGAIELEKQSYLGKEKTIVLDRHTNQFKK